MVGQSTMVVSRGVATGLETALILAQGEYPKDGGEAAQPSVTMVCKSLDFKETSGAARGVRHVSPGDYSSTYELLAMLRKTSSKDSILILDNILQAAIGQLREEWGNVIFVTAYPVFSPGSMVTTVVTTPSCNAFTLSSLYRTLKSAAGNSDDEDEDDAVSVNEVAVKEMTKRLKDGDVLYYRAVPSPEAPVARWDVSTERLSACAH